MTDYVLEEVFPGLGDLMRLRAAAGLSAYPREGAAKGLAGTIHGVSIRRGAEIVGMGRIIGDGGAVFQVVDIAVDPAHQGKGLGKRIMAALSAHIDDALPAGAYVSLTADRPADRLYESFGFRDVGAGSLGMERRAGRR